MSQTLATQDEMSTRITRAERWRMVGLVVTALWLAICMCVVGWWAYLYFSRSPTDPHGNGYLMLAGILFVPLAIALALWAAVSLVLLSRRRPSGWVFHWVAGIAGVAYAGQSLAGLMIRVSVLPSGAMGPGTPGMEPVSTVALLTPALAFSAIALLAAVASLVVAYFGSRAWKNAHQ